jgi:hypothetical protein
MRTHGAYLKVSGALVGGAALIPLAIAAASYISRGGFAVDSSLLNGAHPLGGPPLDLSGAEARQAAQESTASVVETAAPSGATTAMSTRALAVLVACGVLGVALLAGVKRETIGDFVRFPINAREAIAHSDDDLQQIHVDPSSYHHAATITYTFDEYANEYLRRTIGIAAANRIYRDQVPSALWTVRYFRNSQNEEYMVVLTTDGSLHSIHHTVDENAAGANLSKEEAQSRAEAFLRDRKSVNFADWNLVESRTDKKPARTDHIFEWEQKAALDGATDGQGAHIRMQLQVIGDEVNRYRVFIKIPETWRDAESRTTPAQTAQTFGAVALVGIALVTALVVFFRNLKSPQVARVPWRFFGKLSALVLLAGITAYVNKLPQLFMNYTTASPLATYYSMLVISAILVTALYVAGSVILLGFARFFVERAFGPGRIPAWSSLEPAYFRDALFLGVFGPAAVLGLNRLPALFARWPLLRHSLSANVPQGLDVLNPAVGGISAAILAAFLIVGLLGIAASLIAAYVRPRWMRAALLLLFAVLMATDVATPGAFFRDATYHLVALSVVWYGVKHIARFNVLGYFLLAATMTMVPAAIELLRQPNPYLHANGYAIVACVLAMLAWPLVKWQRPR